MSTPPAGWYPDPAEPSGGTERYWDGDGWTEQTRPVVAPTPPLPAPQPIPGPPTIGGPPPAAPGPEPFAGAPATSGGLGGRGVGLLVMAALALAVVIGGVAALLVLRGSDDGTVTTASGGGDTSTDEALDDIASDDQGDDTVSDDQGDDFDFDFDDDPGIEDVREPMGGDQCRVLGLDFADDIQVVVAFTNTQGPAQSVQVNYDLRASSGATIGSGWESVSSPREGEHFVLASDSLTSLPSSIDDVSSISCEISSIEKTDAFAESRGPAGADTCSVTGVDFADDIQAELSFVNPFDADGDLMVEWVLRDAEGTRFASTSEYLEGSAGEPFLIEGDSLSGLPGWVDLDDVTCEIVNFTWFG